MSEQATVIGGVETPKWTEGQSNSVIAALTAAMHAIEEDVSYDYLMGVSGAAFRLQIDPQTWCPSAPYAGLGFNCIKPAMKALGRELVWVSAKEDDSEAIQKRKEATVESIDKGYPVLFGGEECGIIVGYQDDRDKFLYRPYGHREKQYRLLENEKWGWPAAGIIGEKAEIPNERESILRSLEIAVEIADTEKYGDYTSGFAAYEGWVAGLLDKSRFEELDKEKTDGLALGNAWYYGCLVDARAAAARYLRSIAGEFEEDSAVHLSKAAELYDEIQEKLCPGRKYAPFPWDLKEGERWTQEMRHAEADLLKEALALERRAVNELEMALELARGEL